MYILYSLSLSLSLPLFFFFLIRCKQWFQALVQFLDASFKQIGCRVCAQTHTWMEKNLRSSVKTCYFHLRSEYAIREQDMELGKLLVLRFKNLKPRNLASAQQQYWLILNREGKVSQGSRKLWKCSLNVEVKILSQRTQPDPLFASAYQEKPSVMQLPWLSQASPPLHREKILITQCPHGVSLAGTGEANTFPSFFSCVPCAGLSAVPQPENKSCSPCSGKKH